MGAIRNGVPPVNKLDDAIKARDDLVNHHLSQGQNPSTITGGYNKVTGQVAAARATKDNCAEDNVVDLLGGNPDDVFFTPAIRPRIGNEVPVCQRCQGKYPRSSFPPGTKFQGG